MANRVLPTYNLIVNGDMSGEIISQVMNVLYYDNAFFQMMWTGNAVGTLSIEKSADGINFASTSDTVVNNNPGIVQISRTTQCQYIRVHYVASSGTGTLNVVMNASGIV